MGKRVKRMPRSFGWRYILWLAWSNALTILLSIQAIFLQLTIDSEIPRVWTHHLLTAADVLGIVAAQIKRNVPPGPPPRRKRK
jgi:hypothetical protein